MAGVPRARIATLDWADLLSLPGMGAEEALARHKDKVKRRWVSSNYKTDLIIWTSAAAVQPRTDKEGLADESMQSAV